MYNLDKDVENVLSKYKLLNYNPYGQKFNGGIELLSDTGKYIDIFNVEISIVKGFPKCFPKVVEMEGKIPREMARHVMPKDNTLCLAVPIEEILVCRNGITLLWFIDKILVPRLCEEYRVNNGEKYQKEYSHDFGAIWEFLMNELSINDQSKILYIVEKIVTKKLPKGNRPCLCGKNIEYRLCHQTKVKYLQGIKLEMLSDIFKKLKSEPYKGVNL